jgi:hypothetical protein
VVGVKADQHVVLAAEKMHRRVEDERRGPAVRKAAFAAFAVFAVRRY